VGDILGNCLLAFFAQVDVHSEKGACMTFEVSLDDKVRKINKHIRSKTKVPVQDQVLLLGSQTLKSEKKVLSYDLDKETSIHLTLKVVKPSDEALPLILVESSDEGQRHLLRVRRANSVAQVKKMIEDVTGITPEKQIVTCNGKKLEDGKIMENYNITKGSLFFLARHCIEG
jgi:hypothetical protein